MLEKDSKINFLIGRVCTHPECVDLKKTFNTLTPNERKDFKRQGLQLLIDNTTYSQSFYKIFISKIKFTFPSELKMLISDFICLRGQTNKMTKRSNQKDCLDLLKKIPHIF